ncbi:MAG: plastocyanin/azurin family copper-binding protein [Aequorivita sp.]
MKTITKRISVLILGMSFGILILTGFKNSNEIVITPTTHTVIISQMKFNPENLKVKKGDKVVWINKDIVPHDVTEINKKWTSGPMKTGDKWSKTITESFDYFCSIHLVMKGSVTIDKK